MSDLEKKAFKITLIRAFTIIVSIVVITWELNDYVHDQTSKIFGGITSLKISIDQLVADNKEHKKNDSVNKVLITRAFKKIDSLQNQISYIKPRKQKPVRVRYVTETIDADGRIHEHPYNNN